MGIIRANGYYSDDDVRKDWCRHSRRRPAPKRESLAPGGSAAAQAASVGGPVTHDLKSAGLKATIPRLKIISLFETSKVRHLTAEDVYKLLLAEGLDIGLATVYRVLTQFEQAGLLVRHHFESGKAVFELNEGKHHDHLVCMQCGRVEEFYDPEIERRQTRVAKERGFAISEHALYLYADCTKPNCPHRKHEGPN
jgi:Fur family ferric uptake transcriptional regulator